MSTSWEPLPSIYRSKQEFLASLEEARRARRQAQCNRVQLLYQLEPTAAHAQQVRDVIAVLDAYGESD